MTEIQVAMLNILKSNPLIPVLQIEDSDDAIPLAKALKEGGISVLEITLRSEAAYRAIADVAAEFPDLTVGAGTVVHPEQMHKVKELGAQFAISPGLTNTLLDTAKQIQMPLLPGVCTISDMMRGIEQDFELFKFFPAEAFGGVKTLKAFSGPFPNVLFTPTGGITMDNASEYLALSNVVSIGGSWLAPKKLLEGKQWQAITELARDSLAKL